MSDVVDPLLTAERLIRRFARNSNLLLAARPVHVTGDGAVAEALTAMLQGMGSLLDGTEATGVEVTEFSTDSGTFTLGGVSLPPRETAAQRIEFAAQHMPTSRALSEELATAGTVRGLRIGVAMTLEPKTANLALLLAEAGADVAVYAHPDETDPQVAAELRARGIACDADATLRPAAERAAALAFLDRGFDILVHDGSHLIRLAHETDRTCGWLGVSEETTSGLTPLHAMHASAELRVPVIAVNDAATKTDFDNRYGTGQSCVFAIADLLDPIGITVRDQPALVIGYGPVGVGVAAHLRALGAEVRIAERDPLRALVALHDGYRVAPAIELSDGALVISATGAPATIDGEVLSRARVVAVAGGVPGEITLAGRDRELSPVANRVEALGSTLVLDRGGCINVTAAEGNPIEIMDLSFATQLAGIGYLVKARPTLGVHTLPDDVVQHVAQTAARLRGVRWDAMEAAPIDRATTWHSARFRAGEGEPR